ncbi:MAG TPA: hypothetical protein VGK74_16330 [Symbiobacteriaceae bacterium]
MQSVHKESGWPLWPLFAAIPVVLALGFVAGMGVATYRPGVLTPGTLRTGPDQTTMAPPARTTLPPGDSSWIIPTGAGTNLASGASPVTAPNPIVPPPGPQAVSPDPQDVYFPGAATTLDEARMALRTDFGLYRAGGSVIFVDYQKMRQASGSPTLVGIISVRDYDTWTSALQTNPDKLKAWLQGAAARVQAAAVKGGFHLAWAVVDVVRDRPNGFDDREVIPLDNRAFLVIRPLAATVDHAKTEISLRTAVELTQGAAGAVNSPWATYGPVVRFDSTDIYRPLRALDAQPLLH